MPGSRCVNHPDRPTRAKGLCGSCYNKDLFATKPWVHQKANKQRREARAKRPHDPAANRVRQLKSRYGLAIEDYDKMYQDQDGNCRTCGSTVEYRLYVDHDHETGIARELLCAGCNSIAGALESPDCFNVFQYLIEHRSSAAARLELLLRERERGGTTAPSTV